MKKIKLFSSNDREDLQKNIDKWINKEKPDIISQSCSITESNVYTVSLISILYNDKSDITVPSNH